MEQPLPAAIRQRLSPKPNPTSAATGSCLVPAMALYWFFFHNPVPLTKPAGKKKKQNPVFQLGQTELSKGQVSTSTGTQEGCCTQSGEQERQSKKPPVLTAAYWERFSHHMGLHFYAIFCGDLPFPFQPMWTQLPVLADRGWLNWDKGVFFSLRSSKNIFPPLLQVT